MSETKLLPCPFCGGEAILRHNGWTDKDCVVCCVCGCRQEDSNTEDEAAKKWNTRKQIERIADRLKEEIEVLEDFKEFNILHGEYRGCKKAIKIVKEEGMIND